MEQLIAIKKLVNLAKYSSAVLLPKRQMRERFGKIERVQVYFTDDAIILRPVRDLGIDLVQEVPQETNVPQAV